MTHMDLGLFAVCKQTLVQSSSLSPLVLVHLAFLRTPFLTTIFHPLTWATTLCKLMIIKSLSPQPCSWDIQEAELKCHRHLYVDSPYTSTCKPGYCNQTVPESEKGVWLTLNHQITKTGKNWPLYLKLNTPFEYIEYFLN